MTDRVEKRRTFRIADKSRYPQYLVVYKSYDDFIMTCKKQLKIKKYDTIEIHAEIDGDYAIVDEESILEIPDQHLLIIGVDGDPVSPSKHSGGMDYAGNPIGNQLETYACHRRNNIQREKNLLDRIRNSADKDFVLDAALAFLKGAAYGYTEHMGIKWADSNNLGTRYAGKAIIVARGPLLSNFSGDPKLAVIHQLGNLFARFVIAKMKG